jgi:hypothetical protein
MFLLVALSFVVLSHLFLIGVVMMALAAAAGVALYLTRPRSEVLVESPQPMLVHDDSVVQVLPRRSTFDADHQYERQHGHESAQPVSSGQIAS